MKTYKGWELIRDIAEGKIKSGTKVKSNNITYIVQDGQLIYNDEKIKAMALLKSFVNSEDLINNHFELIEEQQDIDVQALQEKSISYTVCKSDIEDGSLTKILNSFFIENQAYIDSILEAVKQLDRKIKEVVNEEK